MRTFARAAAVTAVALLGALGVPAVALAATNLLPNGSFDGGTTAGWKGTNATLKTVSPGFGGTADAAQVSLSNAATAYTMFASPRPVASAAAGQQYQGTASVLGITGRSVCLLLQEYTGSTLAQTAKQCITANGSWQSLIVTPLASKILKPWPFVLTTRQPMKSLRPPPAKPMRQAERQMKAGLLYDPPRAERSPSSPPRSSGSVCSSAG